MMFHEFHGLELAFMLSSVGELIFHVYKENLIFKTQL